MKHEAEEQLIKTLNGQLKDLPGVTKTMVHQYQMASIAECIVSFLIMFILSYAIYRVWKYGNGHKDSFGDWPAPVFVCELVLPIALISITIVALVTLIHAFAPIYGILSGLVG